MHIAPSVPVAIQVSDGDEFSRGVFHADLLNQLADVLVGTQWEGTLLLARQWHDKLHVCSNSTDRSRLGRSLLRIRSLSGVEGKSLAINASIQVFR